MASHIDVAEKLTYKPLISGCGRTDAAKLNAEVKTSEDFLAV